MKNPITSFSLEGDTVRIMNEAGKTIKERFNPPKGYFRENLDSNSFAYYLRQLQLKEFGAVVKYFWPRQTRPVNPANPEQNKSPESN